MAVTYEPIASVTLSTSANSVSIDNIPGTYTDLVVVAFARSTGAATTLGATMRLNDDSGSNYSWTLLEGNGNAPSTNRGTSATRLRLFGDFPTSDYSISVISFMNYANTNVFKTALARHSMASVGSGVIVGLWRSTSAITKMTFFSNDNGGDDLASGTTYSLYGIKAA